MRHKTRSVSLKEPGSGRSLVHSFKRLHEGLQKDPFHSESLYNIYSETSQAIKMRHGLVVSATQLQSFLGYNSFFFINCVFRSNIKSKKS